MSDDLLTAGLLVLAVAATTVCADDTPPFKITTRRSDDRVEVKWKKGTAVISVHSPFGIGDAVIERAGETWPDTVVLRLHLKGLEQFRLTHGKAKLEGSASLRDKKPMVRLWKDGQEDTPLGADSPFWIDVRILRSNGTPAQELPLKDGYFELPLPRALFECRPRAITLDWIDFYRN